MTHRWLGSLLFFFVVSAMSVDAAAQSEPSLENPAFENATLEGTTVDEIETDDQPRETSPLLGLATTSGGLAGLVIGAGIPFGGAALACTVGDYCGLGAVIILGTTAWLTPATTALGVFLAGRAAGGRGQYGLTLLGAAIGGTLGVGALGVAVHSGRDGLGFSLLAIPILEWVGALAAYHLSHKASRNRERENEVPRVLPALQMESGGASLALRGGF